MLEIKKTSQKKVDIYRDGRHIIDLTLLSSSITNKYDIITSYIENIAKTVDGFEEWLENFLTEYVETDHRFPLIEKNISEIKRFSDEYISNVRKIDFTNFVDITKAKKNSIFFDLDDVEKILRLSGYLKIYAIIFNSSNIRLDQRLHKKAYSLLSSDISPDLVYKIFNVIKTKTFKYNYTDKYMWEYIKAVQCKSIDNHVMEIFNFIMDSILVLCEETRNPITYFVTVVDESIKWILRSVYKASVVYDDTISTEDVQSTNSNNLKTYSYNDTLGRLKGIAYKQIYENFEKNSVVTTDRSDEFILDIQRRIENVKYISPFCDFLVYPIISAITDIPYIHLKILSPEHSIVLSVFIQNILRTVIDSDYKHLFSMLNYYPESQPSVITTYKLKNVEHFVNTTDHTNSFFGFHTKILMFDMIGNFIGRISRANFVNVFDGRSLGGIPVSKLELEMINFYNSYFSNQLSNKFLEMRKLVYNEF